MKQIDIFRSEVKEIRGNEASLSKTEVTGGRTLRFKVRFRTTTKRRFYRRLFCPKFPAFLIYFLFVFVSFSHFPDFIS